MTEATIEAFLDHGSVRAGLGARVTEARETLRSLQSLGLDTAEISRTLEEQGVGLFVSAFEEVLAAIRHKAEPRRSAA